MKKEDKKLTAEEIKPEEKGTPLTEEELSKVSAGFVDDPGSILR